MNTSTSALKLSDIALKITHSAELLGSTNKSIEEIASSLCYVSSSQFSTKFKQYYHCTPNTYQREMRLRCNKVNQLQTQYSSYKGACEV